MVVRPAASWPFGATPRYALAEQFQYAGDSAEGWLEPVQQAVNQELGRKGWQSVPLDEADVWVAIGVAGSKDLSDGEIFARLGMTPGLQAKADARKGTLAIVLLDRRTQQAVWSSAISLASDVAIAEGASATEPATGRQDAQRPAALTPICKTACIEQAVVITP